MLKIRKNEYPSKETVNLIIHEKTMRSPSRALPAFGAFLVILVLFVKAGVIEPFNRMYAAQASLKQVQADLSGYVNDNKDYKEIKERHSHYFRGYLTEEEAGLSDRKEVMELWEETVMSQAEVESISLHGNVCRITIQEIPLYGVADIMAELEESPLVQYVSVSTASTYEYDNENGYHNVRADFTITLTGGNE